MKRNLEDTEVGRSLKNDIFNTLGHRSFQSVSSFLKKSRQRDSKYLPYSSQHSIMRSQLDSPNIKTDLSPNRMSPSPPHNPQIHIMDNQRGKRRLSKNQRSNIKKKHPSSKQKKQKQITHAERAKQRSKTKGNKNRSIIRKRNNYSKEEINGCNRSGKSSSLSNQKSSSKQKKSSNKSRKGGSKLNLSSILQQESSEERIITPSSRVETRRKKTKKQSSSEERTQKKQKNKSLSQLSHKRIEESIREPNIYHKILKNELLLIKYKIERKKVIEIEITVLKLLESLIILLNKGNLQCQHIEQSYTKVQQSTKINLFTCVRDINLNEPFQLPRLNIKLQTGQFNVMIEKNVAIPFTWLHFTSELQTKHHKSRIKTKACLQNIKIHTFNLRSLSMILPNWTSKYIKTESRYESHFCIGQNQFEILVNEQRGNWNIQLSGRGQQRLYKMMSFISQFLC